MTKVLTELVGEKLNTADSTEISTSEICGQDQIIGLFFSAQWSPPCRICTSKLVDFYERIRKDGKKFEIIFVSSDQDSDSFKEYFKSMPWYAMKFTDDNNEERVSFVNQSCLFLNLSN